MTTSFSSGRTRAGVAPTGLPSFPLNTAYTGSDGHIDILSLDDDALACNNSSRSSSPTRTLTSTRSRSSPKSAGLLSSALQNSQPGTAVLTRSRSILHSRAKSLAVWTTSFNSPERSPAPSANRLFGDLFSGESAPVKLGILPTSPVKEKHETEFVMEYTPSFTERPTLGRRRTSVSDRKYGQATTKQSWLARKLGGSTTVLPTAVQEHDDLLTLNITNELFPAGPADPFSPSAFNDLLLNATTLLERMQRAYREKTEYIASIKPEAEAQREEVEEAETRAQHLKMQLEEMGRQAQEHERVVQQLTIDLAEEKAKAQQRQQQQQQHHNAGQTIRVVNDTRPGWLRKRSSAGSASDSGFESDPDRDTDSIVSGSTSPPDSPQRRFPYENSASLLRQAHDRTCNITGRNHLPQAGQLRPTNIAQLQEENRQLKQQVEEMTASLQGCIDVLDVLKT